MSVVTFSLKYEVQLWLVFISTSYVCDCFKGIFQPGCEIWEEVECCEDHAEASELIQELLCLYGAELIPAIVAYAVSTEVLCRGHNQIEYCAVALVHIAL